MGYNGLVKYASRSSIIKISYRLLTLLLAFSVSGYGSAKALNAISFSDKQSRTAREVVQRLSRNHYKDKEFGDELSSTLFDQYLINLDPGKSFFTQADVDRFESYRYSLDDQLKKGDLSPGYKMFERYRILLTERLEQNLKQLPLLVENFDFKRADSLETDRSQLPWPVDQKEADALWYKRIKASALNLRLADKSSDEIQTILSKRFENQILRLNQMNSQDVFQVFLNSLAQLYDPHTSYLSPRNSENFNINMSLSLEGIGAVLQREEEFTKVVRLVPAGPADKSGNLQPADRIIAVGQGDKEDMVNVVGWRLDEVVEMIRGPKGTKVRLEIIPAHAAADDVVETITIVRNKVKLEEQSAKSSIIELVKDDELHRIGVIDVPTFYIDFDARRRGDPNYKSTTTDVKRLIDELEVQDVSGIVIDLRDNGGGSLYEANALTRLFIDSGPTVQIRHANSRVDREPRSSYRGAHYTGPMVVLINRLSASASEIFAAAIQDYDRGLVLGGRSFGKGTVQSLTQLTEGHLKLTESKFYRVSGGSTQHKGVIPDIEFPELYDADQVGESALDYALSWDTIHAVQHQHYYPLQDNLPALKLRHQRRIKDDPDFIYLREQIALLDESRARTKVSLNEQERRQQRKDDKTAQLALENKRRELKGLEKLAILDEADDVDGAANEVSGDATTESAETDPFLQEAGQILLDSQPLFQAIVSRTPIRRALPIR
ncbi:MAG: carboxy terminal-processing peptidase [Pseudomonadota bacterium]